MRISPNPEVLLSLHCTPDGSYCKVVLGPAMLTERLVLVLIFRMCIAGAEDATPGNGSSLTDTIGLVAHNFLFGHIQNHDLGIQQLQQVLK